ncbi:MAG: LLM class flavin-dependent oxidoreductase [Pseudoxanthomonas sp.]
MSASHGRPLYLNAFLMATGHHVAGWRHPQAQADGGLDLAHYQRLARLAERGGFDAIFLSDTLAMLPGGLDALSRMARTEHFEPLTLLAALAATTERIGLIATATTSYNDPQALAAAFATLERISGGRAGWNLVTSSNAQEAWNFGHERHPAHADRYQLAERFGESVERAWQARGLAPLRVLAGASEAGKAFAASWGEIVFTAQPELATAQAFYRDLKQRLAGHGRGEDELKVMPGVMAFVGRSRAEAEERRQQLRELLSPVVGLALLSDVAGGVDLSAYPLDGPLPELPPTESGLSRQQLLVELARKQGLSIRQLYQHIADARGHLVLTGTGADIADVLEHWLLHAAADGFNVMPPYLPGGLEAFAEHVLPELRRRGLLERPGGVRTLRARLGLRAPAMRNPHDD